jgi:hypothetical protein
MADAETRRLVGLPGSMGIERDYAIHRSEPMSNIAAKS